MAEPILPEMQDISRQRDLARMLLQRGMSDNLQGQMVSGRFVGASQALLTFILLTKAIKCLKKQIVNNKN